MEVWKPIPDFPNHEASSLGRIRRTTNGKGRAAAGLIMRQWRRPSGYFVVSIAGKKHFVHRLVCSAFHGPAPAGFEVSHENGNHGDCASDNLCWKTHTENEAMKLVHGTKAIGSMCGAAKMTEFGVIAARSAYRLRWHTQSELAAFFGVSRATIGDMISNRTWRHVT